MFFSYNIRQVAFPEDMVSIIKSFFYLDSPADNPVFWTLAVEAQYYLLIGLFFPLLIRHPKITLCLVTPAILLLSKTFLAHYLSFFSHVVFFVIGTIGFLIYSNKGIRNLNFIALLYSLAFAAAFHKFPAFIAAFFTVAFILQYRKPVANLLQFPGKVSYSLYLLHFPIGIKIINLLKPKIQPTYHWLLFIFACAVVIIISWIFFKLFEEYSEKVSKRIRYRAAIKVQVPAEQVAVAN